MSRSVSLTIDGNKIQVPAGTTIYDAALQAGVDIPIICYHSHLTANGLCRICSVDVGGQLQAAACVTQCTEGMEVRTGSPDVVRGRRTNLELLASDVDLEEAPEILTLLQEYDAASGRFNDGERKSTPIYDDNPMYIRDYNQCINCWRCVQVCAEDAQYTYALSFDGRGFHTMIGTFMGDGMTDTTCVFCGQCVGVCPTGALKPKRQMLLERGVDPDQIFWETRAGRRRQRQPEPKEG